MTPPHSTLDTSPPQTSAPVSIGEERPERARSVPPKGFLPADLPLNERSLLTVHGPALNRMLGRSIAAGPEPDEAFRPPRRANRADFRAICEAQFLPGSGLTGIDHLRELAERARAGEPGMVLASHGSNFDVPNLDTLAARVGGQDVFDQLVFLAGRKLGEESPVTQMLSEVYPRLVVTPPAWFEQPGLTKEQLARGRRMNLTALRESRRVLRDGRLLFLFPTGTRERPGRPETRVALSQTANYLRMVKNVCLLGFRGNTLPPHESGVMVREEVQQAALQIRISPVTTVDELTRATFGEVRTPRKDEERQQLADEVMRRIEALRR